MYANVVKRGGDYVKDTLFHVFLKCENKPSFWAPPLLPSARKTDGLIVAFGKTLRGLVLFKKKKKERGGETGILGGLIASTPVLH